MRCQNKKCNQLMTALSAKVVVARVDGKKKYASRTVSAVCFDCMNVAVINPYTSTVTNIRHAAPSTVYWGKCD